VIAKYISHAFSLVGEVTEEQHGMAGIDQIMASGFNWVPPTALVGLLGGRQAVIDLMGEVDVKIPGALSNGEYLGGAMYDVGRYLIAR
jgi:hypothetical protein